MCQMHKIDPGTHQLTLGDVAANSRHPIIERPQYLCRIL